MHHSCSLLLSITVFEKFLNTSLLFGDLIICCEYIVSCRHPEVSGWVSSSDSRVQRCWPLPVLKCADELVNIPRCDRLYGRG